MRKKLLFCCLWAVAAAWGQQVTSVSYNAASVSHSQLQISFTTTGWVGVGTQQTRVRYGTSTCTGGTGGTVQGNVAPTLQSTQNVDIGGLAPNTTYYICPEISVDNANWHGGMAVTVNTLPLPAVHPAPPVPPVTFNTDYPDTTGYTIINEPDCSNLINDYGAAIMARGVHGTVITLPAGAVCAQQLSQYVLPNDPDVHTFMSGAVNTSANTITLPTTANEGQMIRFGTNGYTRLPGSGGSNTAGPIISGMPYFWHVTSGSTGQVYACPTLSSGTTPACSFAQGTLAVLSDAGSGTMAYVTEPRSPNWVIIRTATADSQFVPEHSRLQGPITTDGITSDQYPSPPTQWAPKMAQIQYPYSRITDNQGLAAFGCGDCSVNHMTSHIRFVGIEFAYGPDPYESISSDPDAWGNLISTYPESDNIIFDRCWFHAKGTPERIARAFGWDGMREAIIDSYIDGLHYFHAAMKGLQISGSQGGTSATIGTGSAGFGAGRGTLTSPVNINWSGTSTTGTGHRAFLYFTMTGNQFNVAFPPGVTPTVTGATNTHIVSLAGYGNAAGPALLNRGTSVVTFPTQEEYPDNYYTDPISSPSSTCVASVSLFANLNTAAPPSWGSIPSGSDAGMKFVSDVNQYICGMRFFKNVLDTGTHTGALWSSGGSLLASGTFAGETASGWQTLTFSSPVAVTAGTTYVVSYHSPSGTVYGQTQFRNTDYYNANMHVSGAYIDSNGSGNSTDAWPGFVAELDGHIGPAAGEIAFIDLSGTGTTNDVGNADLQNPHSLNPSNEGCQCMVGGIGPGPYIFRDNFVEGSGNVWHHDDSGGRWDPGRNDYTYTRNYWHMPASTWWTSQYSDGNRYGTRHFLEWKSGVRIALLGNIFNRWYTDTTPTDEAVEFSGKAVLNPPGDIRVEFNSLMHGPGAFIGGGAQEAGTALMTTPATRLLLRNNLAWDIDGRYCVYPGGGFACPTQGWFVEGVLGEDSVYDHNTVLVNTATSGVPVFLYSGDMAIEGVQVTNNFMVSEPGRYSVSGYFTDVDSCRYAAPGEGTASCKFTPSYVWAGNVFLGSGATAAQIQSAWPNHLTYPNGQPMNYFVGNQNTTVVNPGWFSYNPSNPIAGGNFRVSQNYCSGCGRNATDSRDIGADIDALEAAQGVVTLNGVPDSSITSTSAMVVFVAPDSAGCSVDYSSTDPSLAAQFTRSADAGGPRVRNVSLSGLSGQTSYYYRVNCAVQQPTGHFRTR